MRWKTSLTLLLFVLLFAGAYDVSAQSKSPQAAVVNPGDFLQVVVWKEPSLSGTVSVRSDGAVTLPLINDVQVAGLTITQLRETLEQRFREFIPDVYVTVRVERGTTTRNSNPLVDGLPRSKESTLKDPLSPGTKEQKPLPGLDFPL